MPLNPHLPTPYFVHVCARVCVHVHVRVCVFLEIKPSTLHIVGQDSATELYLQDTAPQFLFWMSGPCYRQAEGFQLFYFGSLLLRARTPLPE